MKRKIATLAAAAVLLAACGNSDREEAVRLAATNFADCLFGFRYAEAAALATPESRPVLEFMASNVSGDAVEQMHDITDVPAVEVKSVKIDGDSVAHTTVAVTNEVLFDSIGSAPAVCKAERRYTFTLVRSGEEWLVRMASLPRSEK